MSGCKMRMAEWQPTSTPMLHSLHAPLGVVAASLLYWHNTLRFCPEGLTTFCPSPCCCSSYYLDNDVGCVPSPLALDETSYEAGIKVQLHTQSEPPFLHELGFGVAPGFQTFVSTQEQRVAYDCLVLLHATNTVLFKKLHIHHQVHSLLFAGPLLLLLLFPWGMDPSDPPLCGWSNNMHHLQFVLVVIISKEHLMC